jgi:cysteine desulfurase / selenocysteine lyase
MSEREMALVPRADFLGLDGLTHLYTAAECPLLVASAEALQEYARLKATAEAGRARAAEVTLACKAALGQLMAVDPADLAFMPSASDGINAVCGLLDLRPGDNVVVNDLEFASVTLPWLRLRERGIEVRVVRHRDWDISTEALLAAVDSRTRLMGLSHVSYINGLRHDVEALSGPLRAAGVVFLLDATQSLGVLPVPASAADFVVSSTYKWLLGTHGLGVFYWNRARRPEVQPAAIGWYSLATTFGADRYERYTLKADAGRFETGYVNFPAIYALSRSVPYLHELGMQRIADHALALGDLMIEGLEDLGVEVMSPADRRRRGASISFAHPRAAEIGHALAAANVHVWAGDGRVRASTHLFNGQDDVERYLDVLAGVLARV